MVLPSAVHSSRDVGDWGEALVDGYMERYGWQVMRRNWRIRGGEIDRVYEGAAGLCIAEVKVLWECRRGWLCGDTCLARIRSSFRPRQINNLFRIADRLAGDGKVVWVRVFVVLKALPCLSGVRLGCPVAAAAKVCEVGAGQVLLSFAPDVILRGSR